MEVAGSPSPDDRQHKVASGACRGYLERMAAPSRSELSRFILPVALPDFSVTDVASLRSCNAVFLGERMLVD